MLFSRFLLASSAFLLLVHKQPANEIDIVFWTVLAGLLTFPAIFGIILYFTTSRWLRKAVRQLQTTPSNTILPEVLQSKAPTDENQGTPLPYTSEKLDEHHFFLVPFDFLAEIPSAIVQRATKASSISRIDSKIENAIKKWQQNSQLKDIITLASQALIEDIPSWVKLDRKLKELSSSLSPDDARNIEQQGIAAIYYISSADDVKNLRWYCSESLVCYTMLSSWLQPSSENHAAILFDMGYAYISLARTALETVSDLLTRSWLQYKNAQEIYESNSASKLYARTLVALGDVYVALSKTPEGKEDQHLQAASGSYQQAYTILLPYLSSQADYTATLPYSPSSKQLDYTAILPYLPAREQIHYKTILASLPLEIQKVLKERILVLYLINLLTRIPPMSVNH